MTGRLCTGRATRSDWCIALLKLRRNLQSTLSQVIPLKLSNQFHNRHINIVIQHLA